MSYITVYEVEQYDSMLATPAMSADTEYFVGLSDGVMDYLALVNGITTSADYSDPLNYMTKEVLIFWVLMRLACGTVGSDATGSYTGNDVEDSVMGAKCKQYNQLYNSAFKKITKEIITGVIEDPSDIGVISFVAYRG